MSDEELVLVNPKQVLFLHDEQVKLHGGSFGVRDWGMLKSACLQPYVSLGGIDLYPTIFEKAGALIRSIVKDHPFVDANKRTAITAAQVMLELSGYEFKAKRKETYDLLLAVANENLGVEEIAKWLKKRVKRGKV